MNTGLQIDSLPLAKDTVQRMVGLSWGRRLRPSFLFTLLFLLMVLLACQREPSLHGAWPVTPTPAADFTLTAQSGEMVQLSNFRGDLVVLTFIYSNCVTACPLITFKLKMVADQLTPEEAGQVRFVGVSLDPERDTLQAATKYLEALPSPQGMLFLTGTREALESVWRSYKVEAKQVMTTPKEGTPIEGSHAGHKGYIVAHNIIAYLIDTQGVVRAVYVPDQDFESGDLVKDMRTLLSVR